MKPGSGHHHADAGTYVAGERLERLAVPLTVLHANIQLLQRRIRKGKSPDPDGLLRILDKMEQASRTLCGELRELHDTVSTQRHVRETIDRNRSFAVHDQGERDV